MISFPWDSRVTGFGDNGYPIYDRTYGAEQLRDVYQTFFSNGVFMQAGDPSLLVSAGSGMSVEVAPGRCNVQGTIGVEKSARSLVLQAASSADRIDTVVLRWDTELDVRSIDLYVKQGTAGASPRPPELTRNELMWELGLANVYVTANSTSVSASRITDTRLDTARCGIVTPFSSIDTTTFYEQIQTAIDERLGEINESASGAMAELESQTNLAVQVSKDAIDGTLAGNLTSRLAAVEQDKADKTELQDGLDGKVDRAGDTMTGTLRIDGNHEALHITDGGTAAVVDVETGGGAVTLSKRTVDESGKLGNSSNVLYLDDDKTRLFKPLDIASGGTGGTSRVSGFNGLAFLGSNPTSSASADTRAFWQGLGSGYAMYTATGRLNGQPSQYGFLLNYTTSQEVHQEFWVQSNGAHYRRGGNGSTAAMPGWVRVLDTTDLAGVTTKSSTAMRLNGVNGTAVAGMQGTFWYAYRAGVMVVYSIFSRKFDAQGSISNGAYYPQVTLPKKPVSIVGAPATCTNSTAPYNQGGGNSVALCVDTSGNVFVNYSNSATASKEFNFSACIAFAPAL